MRARSVDELLDVAVERPAADQFEIEVGGALEAARFAFTEPTVGLMPGWGIIRGPT